MIFHNHCYHIGCAPGGETCLSDEEYKRMLIEEAEADKETTPAAAIAPTPLVEVVDTRFSNAPN